MNRNTEFIPFSRPFIGKEEEDAVLRVLRSGWLTTGPETEAFEKEFGSYTGSLLQPLALNSATAGLHLALEAIGIKENDHVLTTPFTFTATAEVIRYMGAHPVFADIDRNGNIDPLSISQILKKNHLIKAVIPVHLGGKLCDMDSIMMLASQYEIPVIEDAAHCFPVFTDKGAAGTIGDFGVYSFYANKTITTGEGGMVCTRNEKALKRMKIMRLHGIDRDIWQRFTKKGASWEYDIVAPGFKYNMTDIAAAIGRVQLNRAMIFLEERKKIARTYFQNISECDLFSLPEDEPHHAWHLFTIQIRGQGNKEGIRNKLIHFLQEKGIGTSVHYRPLHLMSYYKNTYSLKETDLPVSTDRFKRILSLPIYPGLKEEQQEYICTCLKEADRILRNE